MSLGNWHPSLDDRFERWLSSARGQSLSDLDRCLEACRGHLLTWAREALPVELRPKCSPSDLVQDSLIDARASFVQFNGQSRDELLAWLQAILRNNALDVARKIRGRGSNGEGREGLQVHGNELAALLAEKVDPGPSPSSVVRRADDRQQLIQAIARLPEDYRLAVTLRSLEGLSYRQVGERLGRSEEAVRQLWRRGFRLLVREFEDADDSR